MKIVDKQKFIMSIVLIIGLVMVTAWFLIPKPTPEPKIVKEVVTETEIVEVEKEVTKYETINFKGEVFTVTAYCSCEICTGVHSDGITASGSKATAKRTLAVDKGIIPLGSKIVLEGHDSLYIAEDTGNPKYMSGKRIDIYFDSHEEAKKFGVQELKVWVIQDERDNN